MELYRAAISREILWRLIPSIILSLLFIIGLIILVKYIGGWAEKGTKIFVLISTIVVVSVCSLILFFDTKELFADLNSNNFVDYYGEATYHERRSSKDFNCYQLNDENKTIVTSKVGKVEATIRKCIAHVVYGGESKFVIAFDVEEVIEERPPVNFP